ncbi:MAG: hypothetical protein H8F28_24180 [Fibrella sp.]|nr:hypothetical protein [Armatimonadota bacterium]
MDPLVNPDAPLPELHRQPHRVVAQNSWQQLVATAPLNSERVRYNTTSPTPLPGASRSTFRNGSLQFTEQGIQIEGMAVVPNLRLVQATGTIHLCFIFVYAVFAFGSILISGMRHFGSVGAVFLWTGIALRAVVAFALERRRTPATQFVPWTDVAGAQIDRGGKWITLIYRTSVQ